MLKVNYYDMPIVKENEEDLINIMLDVRSEYAILFNDDTVDKTIDSFFAKDADHILYGKLINLCDKSKKEYNAKVIDDILGNIAVVNQQLYYDIICIIEAVLKAADADHYADYINKMRNLIETVKSKDNNDSENK